MVKEQSKKDAESSTFYINMILHPIFHNPLSVHLPLKRPSKFSRSALISLRIFSCPCDELLAMATSPVCCRCSTSNSPCACLFNKASKGATAFSIASLSLKGRCFIDGIFSLARVNQLVRSS